MHGADPQSWELGVKEVWEVQKPLDRVIHTLGWPLRWSAKHKEAGGSFIYPMGEDKVCIGLVVGLDYTDATFSVHDALQLFKTHPFIKKIIEGGKRVAWGAKTIPSGGYWAMPKRLSVPGMVIAGDAAGMVNIAELKGVHYAMHAGMYAAEAIVEALKRGLGQLRGLRREGPQLGDREGPLPLAQHAPAALQGPDLRRRHGHARWSRPKAPSRAGTGRSRTTPRSRWRSARPADKYPKPDNELTFNKLDSVFLSGNATRDDAPNHVRIQTRVPREIAQTWVSMCPAQVYEIPDDQLENGAAEVDVHVTASNCVQCGAITAKGGRLTLAGGWRRAAVPGDLTGRGTVVAHCLAPVLALGIVAAVGASLLYNTSIALQALEAREVPGEHSLRPSLIGRLVRNRRWLGATGLGLLGWPLEIGALLLAPLTVVQPCLASGLILLLWLGATKLGEAPGRREAVAVTAIIAGIGGVAWAAPDRTTDHAGAGAIALALGLVAIPIARPTPCGAGRSRSGCCR